MQPYVELDAFLGIEAVESSYHGVSFQQDHTFAEHGQTQGCGKTGKTGPDDGDVAVAVYLLG